MKIIDTITMGHTTTVLTEDCVGAKAAYQSMVCDNSQANYLRIAYEGQKLSEGQARILWPNIDIYRK